MAGRFAGRSPFPPLPGDLLKAAFGLALHRLCCSLPRFRLSSALRHRINALKQFLTGGEVKLSDLLQRDDGELPNAIIFSLPAKR